jgi:mono/diheme cytochrome c family protein
MGLARALFVLSIAAVSVAPGIACSDPITTFRVRELGDEKPGVPEGEYHRAGQPCIVCHREGGKSKTTFVLAGTVFTQPGKAVGLDSAKVQITDSAGAKYTATTNCVGNFYIKPSDGFEPKFPLLVRVVKENRSRSMGSQIGRAPDCADCHRVGVPSDSPDIFATVPQVYLYTDDEPAPPKSQTCPVDPDLGIERK